MHILLIEPDKVQAYTYQQALEGAGHTVDIARNAQASVQCADEHTPDVVVLELRLPQHNGVEFLYEFRSYTEWLSVPVIIHSFVRPAQLVQSMTLERELGVTQVLYKPETTLAMLCDAVRVAPVVNA